MSTSNTSMKHGIKDLAALVLASLRDTHKDDRLRQEVYQLVHDYANMSHKKRIQAQHYLAQVLDQRRHVATGLLRRGTAMFGRFNQRVNDPSFTLDNRRAEIASFLAKLESAISRGSEKNLKDTLALGYRLETSLDSDVFYPFGAIDATKHGGSTG